MNYRTKLSIVIVAITLLTVGTLVVLTSAVAQDATEPLNILLVGDDGWNAQGISKMKQALDAAGHTVTVVAPDSNQSGVSMALNLDLPFFMEVNHGDDIYSLIASNFSGSTQTSATPAMCVLWGLYKLDQNPPDLILSGINDGANVGTGTVLSGTVGAAIMGMEMGTPSIAISTNLPYASNTIDTSQQTANEAHFENVANFAVSLIEHLQNKPGSLANENGLLPDGVSLNVNYPTLAPEDVAGVKRCISGVVWENIVSFRLSPYHSSGDIYMLSGKPNPNPLSDVKNSDVVALDEGYITIVPVEGDYTIQQTQAVESWINGLNQ